MEKLSRIFKGLFSPTEKEIVIKTNEIIDYINNNPIPSAVNYKIYRALLTQSGTDAPEAIVLENTLGDIVWTRANVGIYEGTLASAFTANKTICPQFPALAFETNGTYLPISANGNPQLGWINAYCQTDSVFTINTLDLVGSSEWSTILGSTFLLEIIVYN